MKIEFYCPRWGSENLPWEEFLAKVEEAGYDGIEWAIANNTNHEELRKVFDLAEHAKLAVIVQHYETNFSNFKEHVTAYSIWLEKIRPYPFIKINSQTGKDYFSVVENTQLIDLANSFGRKHGVPVVHETHRGKFSFAAHVTRPYLQAVQDLRITLDASHWCAVAESYLDDQADVMQLAIERTDHIHARVGYPEGPQISDPRAAEWLEALDKHLSWWDGVVTLKRNAGSALTITTEFGPFPYMVNVPRTGEPIASQWDVNLYMMKLLKERYGCRR